MRRVHRKQSNLAGKGFQAEKGGEKQDLFLEEKPGKARNVNFSRFIFDGNSGNAKICLGQTSQEKRKNNVNHCK